MNHTYSISIDIGGTNTDMGLVRDDGTIIARSNIPTNSYTVFDPYIHDIMEHISTMMKENNIQQLEGIGIGAPNGNFYTGCVDNAPNLTIKGVLDFAKEIHKYMDTTVVLSNDANAAAFGEMVYGGAKGLNHFIMFTLGTGVGSGIVIDGKLVHGSTGAAGELGHRIDDRAYVHPKLDAEAHQVLEIPVLGRHAGDQDAEGEPQKARDEDRHYQH